MTPANGPAPARPAEPTPPPVPAAPANGYAQWFREGITAVISLSVTGVALYMLLGTFWSGAAVNSGSDQDAITAKTDAYNRQKDVMLYGLALLGTVAGYYLGRVPAELHAQQAQNTANLAQQQRDQAKQDEATTKLQVKTGLKKLAGQLETAAAPRRPTLGGAEAEAQPAAPFDLTQARAAVDALLEKVS